MPFLVNPQTDALPTYARQTIKHVIDFACDTDMWPDDAVLPSRQRLTGAMCHHREFQFADGRCTHAESTTPEDMASAQGPCRVLPKR